MAADPAASESAEARTRTYTRFLFRAPSPPVAAAILLPLLLAESAIVWFPSGSPQPFLEGFLVVFLLPSAAAVALTTPVAEMLGGQFAWRRSFLLAITVPVVSLPVLGVWRLLSPVAAVAAISVPGLLLLVQGPALWLRHLSIFGISKTIHARSLPVALIQPIVGIVGVFVLYPPTTALLVAAVVYLLIAFGCAVLLLRAADRPMRREFGISGASLIRPLLDHVNLRDESATATIEAFFRRFAIPADLRVTLVSFVAGARTKATLALPTVHPGPFAALGASDLPRKMAEALGGEGGTIIVPHTPCNHDLDLPTGAEVRRVQESAKELLGRLPVASSPRASPLVSGNEGSLVRAQVLGDAMLVLVTQAPAPTDDIDFSLADQLVREYRDRFPLAIIDAHNSYVEGKGDITYGTPTAERMLEDARQAIEKAAAVARPGPVQVGVAARTGYTIAEHGIAPEGVRAFVVRAAGTTTAYVLIDGNNLLIGMRQPILDRLRGLVDAAEVMTTDNHVVHEVDGTINAVGERYPVERLAADVRTVVEAAIADLTPVEVRAGMTEVKDVPVLGPDWTARLLTSLGDTVSMFANTLLTTFLLLLAGSLVVLMALR